MSLRDDSKEDPYGGRIIDRGHVAGPPAGYVDRAFPPAQHQPLTIAKLLRGIAGGTVARTHGHDTILILAAETIERFHAKAATPEIADL